MTNIDVFKKCEQILKLRAKILQAEHERLEGLQTLKILDARKQLRERINGL